MIVYRKIRVNSYVCMFTGNKNNTKQGINNWILTYRDKVLDVHFHTKISASHETRTRYASFVHFCTVTISW